VIPEGFGCRCFVEKVDRFKKMSKPRTPISDDVSAEVMFQHDRTCCVCHVRGKAVQIHHIDEDPTNHAVDNLAVLCLDHHDETQVRGGFAKKLKAADVVRCRADWIDRVRARREKIDELVVQHTAGMAPTPLEPEDWSTPSTAQVIGFLNALPSIRRAAIAAAQPLWETGITTEMRRGSYDAIDILESAWLRLANFYPPNHFGERAADHFFSEFVAGRFEWHRNICEPRGAGSSGTLVHVTAGGGVLDDVANAIEETVEGLFIGYCLHPFDLKTWRSDWDVAGRRDAAQQGTANQSRTEHALRIIVGTGEPFERVIVNEHGVHRTLFLGIKNIGASKVSNCCFYRTYISSLNDSEKTLLADTFSLDPNEVRYVSVAMFNETKDLPAATHMIGLSIPPNAFGYGLIAPRLIRERRHIISFLAESPDTADAAANCEIWVDEDGKLRISVV
jgi:hypothetical protein